MPLSRARTRGIHSPALTETQLLAARFRTHVPEQVPVVCTTGTELPELVGTQQNRRPERTPQEKSRPAVTAVEPAPAGTLAGTLRRTKSPTPN